MKTKLYSALSFFLLITTCAHLSMAEVPKRNSILFLEIDDWVEVFVNGKKVFRQAASEGNLNGEVEFDLNPHIAGIEDPIVEIKLINAKCPTCEAGNGWKVEFEIFQDDESVDYLIEEGDSKGGGAVFSIEYEWGYI